VLRAKDVKDLKKNKIILLSICIYGNNNYFYDYITSWLSY